MKDIIKLMMEDKKLNKQIKDKLGKFLIKNNDIFTANLLYSEFLNLKDLEKIYSLSDKDKNEKNEMIVYFLTNKSSSLEEKDLLLSKLEKYDLSKENLKKIFISYLEQPLKIKHFDRLLPEEDKLKYLYKEELTMDFLKKHFPDKNNDEIFFECFKRKLVNIPSELVKIKNLSYLINLKSKVIVSGSFSYGEKDYSNLTEEETQYVKINYFDNKVYENFFNLTKEEVILLFKKPYSEQIKLFESELNLVNLYNNYGKTIDFKKSEYNEDLPLKCMLSLKKFDKKELNNIINEELENHSKNNKNNKSNEKLKLTQDSNIYQIMRTQNYNKELMSKYNDKINIRNFFSFEFKNLTKKEKINIIKNNKDVNLLSIYFEKEKDNLTLEEEKYFKENSYLNDNNLYMLINFKDIKDENIYSQLRSEDYMQYIFREQKLSKSFLNKHTDNAIDKKGKILSSIITKQEHLPEKILKYLKDQSKELMLINNLDYMYNKDIKPYEEKVMKFLSEKHSGGSKFSMITNLIINKILKNEKLRIEYKNSKPILIKEKDYDKKYSYLKENNIENNIESNI